MLLGSRLLWSVVLSSVLILQIASSVITANFCPSQTCLLGILSAEGQELPTITRPETIPKMESTLAQLYKKYLQGEDIGDFVKAHDLYVKNGAVRIIIELVDDTTQLPEDLGIVEESRHAGLVQALVPMQNLDKLSLYEEVAFLRVPIKLNAAGETEENGRQAGTLNPLYFLAIIPAVVVGALYYRRKGRHA